MKARDIRVRLLAVVWLLLSSSIASATDAGFSHGYSVFGTLKYPPDFTHYDYANPDAPKGGALRISYIGTFDTLNQFVVNGTGAWGLQGIYDRLMSDAHDESGSNYGLLAESIRPAPDYSWVEFKLRPEARWNDGEPVTVEDVIFTLQTIQTKGTPIRRSLVSDVERAEKTGPRTVRFTFTKPGQTKLCLTIGRLTILPKHYWEGRDFGKTTLEPPLGSGPYRIKSFDQGRSITYERVKDYWAKDLPVQRGQHNFDTITYEYYRDVNTRFEAFKSGHINYRLELSSALWATGYDFDAVANGDIVKTTIRTEDPAVILAWGINNRRDRFKDVRVRQAIDLAFDFSWVNKNFFFGLYERSNSYFANSSLGASGVPTGVELRLLEPWRASLPPELFEREYRAPETNGSGNNRAALLEAIELLKAAGWDVKDGKLTNRETGNLFTLEFLVNNALMERSAAPYIKSLKRLGIDASVRLVDSSQYAARTQRYDFDMMVVYLPQASLPTRSLKGFWGSESASYEGSLNYSGISDPALDAMLDVVATANDPEEYYAAIKAADRILLWNHYMVPLYHPSGSWRAHSSELKRKTWVAPMYDDAFPESWWFDASE